MTEEEIDALMEFVRDHFPVIHDRLLLVRERDEQRFQRMLRRAGRPVLHLLWLKRQDPEMADLLIDMQKTEMEIRRVRHDLGDRPEAQRQEREAELRQLLDRQFDLRLQRLELKLKRIEEELANQKRQLQRYRAGKDIILEQEYQRLINGVETTDDSGTDHSR